jgi:hypothetical protein
VRLKLSKLTYTIFRHIQICLRRVLRLLDEAVQQDHLIADNGEQDTGNTPVQVDPHFPHVLPISRTKGIPSGQPICTVLMSSPIVILSAAPSSLSQSRTASLPASVLKNRTSKTTVTGLSIQKGPWFWIAEWHQNWYVCASFYWQALSESISFGSPLLWLAQRA